MGTVTNAVGQAKIGGALIAAHPVQLVPSRQPCSKGTTQPGQSSPTWLLSWQLLCKCTTHCKSREGISAAKDASSNCFFHSALQALKPPTTLQLLEGGEASGRSSLAAEPTAEALGPARGTHSHQLLLQKNYQLVFSQKSRARLSSRWALLQPCRSFTLPVLAEPALQLQRAITELSRHGGSKQPHTALQQEKEHLATALRETDSCNQEACQQPTQPTQHDQQKNAA